MIRTFRVPEWSAGDPNTIDRWASLLRGLGADPRDIPVPSTVVYDDETRRLTYEVYVRDENGSLFIGPDGDIARGEMTIRLDEHPVFPE